MPGINWGVVATVIIAVAGLVGTLISLLFNARLDALKVEMENKVDHEEANFLIENAIGRYHDRIVVDLKNELNERHKENTRKLDSIYALLMDRYNKNGAMP